VLTLYFTALCSLRVFLSEFFWFQFLHYNNLILTSDGRLSSPTDCEWDQYIRNQSEMERDLEIRCYTCFYGVAEDLRLATLAARGQKLRNTREINPVTLNNNKHACGTELLTQLVTCQQSPNSMNNSAVYVTLRNWQFPLQFQLFRTKDITTGIQTKPPTTKAPRQPPASDNPSSPTKARRPTLYSTFPCLLNFSSIKI